MRAKENKLKTAQENEMTEQEIQDAYDAIEMTIRSFLNQSRYLLKHYSVEDLAQETFTHFLEKDFFPKFDGRTSFRYFVFAAAKRFLIDLTRKRRHLEISLSTPVAGKEGIENSTLEDFVQNKISDQYSATLIEDLLDNCSDARISPNYDLTWKTLLKLVIAGFTPKEIHKMVGISSGRVCQLITQLRADMV